MSAPASAPWRSTAPALVLRLLGAAGLALSAYLHTTLARGPLVTSGSVTLAGLFLAQAAVATLVAGWVLLRGTRSAWLATAAVGLGSLLALVLSVYVQIPSIGPFPALHEPFWYGEKAAAAAAAATAAGAAAAALGRRRH